MRFLQWDFFDKVDKPCNFVFSHCWSCLNLVKVPTYKRVEKYWPTRNSLLPNISNSTKNRFLVPNILQHQETGSWYQASVTALGNRPLVQKIFYSTKKHNHVLNICYTTNTQATSTWEGDCGITLLQHQYKQHSTRHEYHMTPVCYSTNHRHPAPPVLQYQNMGSSTICMSVPYACHSTRLTPLMTLLGPWDTWRWWAII